MPADFAPVIGLEIHVQLRTATKMFCGDRARYGAPPNRDVCPVCLGLPGSLPTINAHAVELGVVTALGFGCDLALSSRFDRKAYLYPDLPKGYQITQHEQPLAVGGALEVPGPWGARRIGIRRVHLEEDTARSSHTVVPGATALDFNRAGIPLLEIVTEPELRSPAEARAFLVRLTQVLRYLDVSDCAMEEGSLRVDANLSMRGPGEELGLSTEIKNLNSFSKVERALAREAGRQAAIRRSGGRVEPVTLAFDSRGALREMRIKESAEAYRYFPEPDLPTLELDGEWVEELRTRLPEMPWIRAGRIARSHGLGAEHASALTATPEIADFYERLVGAGAAPGEAASWVLGEVLGECNASGLDPGDLIVGPERLAALLSLVERNRVSRTAARRVFVLMLQSDASPEELVEREGLTVVSGRESVELWVREALLAEPETASRLRRGERKLIGYFVGRVMRISGGAADPSRVRELLEAESETF
jgi:aspartyl-tRNA(Asn)/glutamyl-tRNA(Gln) amidotransferase subunit B